MSDSLPDFADSVVVGGGTAGAAIAGELAARSDQSLLLLEAGPDYGSFADGRWPADLADARVKHGGWLVPMDWLFGNFGG